MNGDIRTMDPREVVRGLMRGYKPDFQMGYDAAAATQSVVHLQDLSDDEAGDLLAYAEGYALGMSEGLHPENTLNPVKVA
jgi:hypothetical protein